MTNSTFIFIHDQDLIVDCDIKFAKLQNLKYVFLGSKDTSKISSRQDVIIARDLNINIESIKNFCSFTGWYALWKNDLITTSYVTLLEYDVLISKLFNQQQEAFVRSKFDFMGFIPLSINRKYYLDKRCLGGVTESIKRHHGVDVENFMNLISIKNPQQEWSSTSNCTMSTALFNNYMKWFEYLIEDLKTNPMCGHAHERSISFYYMLNNSKVLLTRDLIEHKMLRSHQS